MGFVGKTMHQQNLDVGGLTSYLGTQSEMALANAPGAKRILALLASGAAGGGGFLGPIHLDAGHHLLRRQYALEKHSSPRKDPISPHRSLRPQGALGWRLALAMHSSDVSSAVTDSDDHGRSVSD